ncbi:hypothetical protein BABINDRAFT_159476 [Babjeviella inositovora NRRL Y-12698]|uniref:Mediator of RNA polymerase II transcription subunit 9 n=1 Tax=Babjeviella inositovora NRRL Y-12698 TaxID=984486 RepID=A0A1E3R0T9_9ASCO|nr:uncharacterized protein BABINDRAFT_159476 [Babjeviella inositovora NRRL Y-12698]ODQ82997.1 hypothetical protein BABINDRAFT_159476 [Babjeviella inositovora NRRL Y-12698]
MDIDTEFKQFPTPELETLVGTIDKEQLQVDALAQITRDTELLPALIELIEDVKSGRISVQEFGNHAGPLRRKISRIKQNLVANIDGLEETNDDRQFQINEFKSGIEKKKYVKARFTPAKFY